MRPDAPVTLVFGTSGRTGATNPRDGFRGSYPAGTGHAVPDGSRQALCGATPPHVWAGPFDADSRILTICRECVVLARGRL